MLRKGLLASVLIVSLAAFGAVTAQDAGDARPFLGVTLDEAEAGVAIAEVVADSAADDAGLQAGDVITALNGAEVTTPEQVVAVIAALGPGDVLTLAVLRDGEPLTREARLGTAPEPQPGGGRNQLPVRPGLFGADVLVYDANTALWTALAVAEDGALAAVGLLQGDVITAVDGEARDPAALRAYLDTLGADAAVEVTIQRGDDEIVAEVPAAVFDEVRIAMQARVNPADRLPNLPLLPGGPLAPNADDGFLGVSFITLTAATAADAGIEFVDGALIGEVVPDAPAADAGLLVGDIITAVNREPVNEEITLADRISAYEPGDVITLAVLRDGAPLTIEVTLGDRPRADAAEFGFGVPGMFREFGPFFGGDLEDFFGEDFFGGESFRLPDDLPFEFAPESLLPNAADA
ncbi:MAG: PDZ domain-containing protein [Chloroflexi bacterium]|nr:PDZ domain-containing protein [Chloroflexota bacterium]